MKKGKTQGGSLRQRVGYTLREFREKNGYSQEGLARLMGISRTTISKIENGKFSITIDSLEKFADFFEFSLTFKEGLKKNE